VSEAAISAAVCLHVCRRCVLISALAFLVRSTWDLFKYPGIRSDSDMSTLGFGFQPWTSDKAIADGPDILEYVKQTVKEKKLEECIRCNVRVTDAEFISSEARWHLDLVHAQGANEKPSSMTCQFLLFCTGYYRYDAGFQPTWEGQSNFKGKLVHPQHWPEGLALKDKKVVVIGSGATAVTLVPAIVAEGAKETVMLQRSPTYIASAPSIDTIGIFLRRWLPIAFAYFLIRWKNILYAMYTYTMCQFFPDAVKKKLQTMLRAQLPTGYPIETHLQPKYNPWEQRFCLDPDGKMFKAIYEGKAEIVTDTIVKFNERGIECTSGRVLDADIIVSATGLQLLFAGGIQLKVDGKPIAVSEKYTYLGMMLSDVPNAFTLIGYTNASWTLKCELIAQRVCDIIRHMETKGRRVVIPVPHSKLVSQSLFNLSSGYVQRAASLLPKASTTSPWTSHQNYLKDVVAFRWKGVEDGELAFV
jgi:monooxygenase